MKRILQIMTLLLFAAPALAQTGHLKGKVLDNSQDPLIGVTVMVVGTEKGAITDIDGSFNISGLPTGTAVVRLSFVGFKTVEITTTIEPNKTTLLEDITLYEGNEILQDVVVTGSRVNAFSREQTAYVAKLPLKDLENTQVYSTITSDLLESQTVTSFEDALKNATGVDKLWTSTGRGGDGAGYYSLRGFSVQPQLVNGMPGLTNGTINAANIERIEVIKGPSATLFGNSVGSYGGIINVVTKKPFVGRGGSVNYTTGSFGLNQLTLDYNTALDSEENVYFRINTSYLTKGSFQDAGFRETFFIAPSLSYRVNNRLSFNFYGEITEATQTNPTMLFLNRAAPSEAGSLEELGYNNELSFTSNHLTLSNPTSNFRAEANYKLSDNWTSQTLVSTSHTTTDGYYSYLYDYGILGGNTFTRFISKQNAQTNTFDIQQNFTGDFLLGGMRHRVLIGLDYLASRYVDNSSGYAFYGNVRPNGEAIADNPFTPAVETGSFPLTTAAVDAALAAQGHGSTSVKREVLSSYISDVVNITPRFSAMASLRFDRFKDKGNLEGVGGYDQFTLSPKFGLLYQPVADKLSIFANYQNSFNNVAPALVGDPNSGPQSLKVFDPEQANQLEFGVKANLLDYRLNATLSYYDITVSDVVMTDPSDPFNRIQEGEVVSSGFELEVNANPIDGLNLRATFADNDSETTNTDNANIAGRRPLGAGPEKVYSFWASYRTHKGLGVGAGFNGASERATINYAATGNFILPEYTIANASVFYEVSKFRIALKVNNLFNKEYYSGWTTITPQEPRAFLASFKYSF
ncbi:TonB-dependent receptor [Roseivirga sp. UBA838]|uniref:TonB-dependent receptor n=1 Tax=Roseivirga sp. UBA838 TaxID=1947393 RepID=UPI00258048CD|nr:TonB-dependent receptor [Roseivirga sp. UBA838]|tara:strand:- start:10089 stop:12497 length:2409 start_codon:yes stop_codon:yes gene_type:complete